MRREAASVSARTHTRTRALFLCFLDTRPANLLAPKRRQVVLYFQQLPSAAVLFDLAARQRRRRGGGEADAEAVALLGGHTGSANGLKALGDGAPAVAAAAAEQQQRQQQQHYRAKASPQPSAAEGELEAAGAGSDPEWAAGGPAHHRHPHHQQPHSNSQRGSSRRPLRPKAPEAPGAAAVTVAAAEADSEGGGAAALLLMAQVRGNWEGAGMLSHDGCRPYMWEDGTITHPLHHTMASQNATATNITASPHAQNPMVWSTAAALALSCLGSSALLDPASPARLALLAPIEPLLAWFAGCAAPVTLFCTGLWAEAQPPGAAPARGEVRRALFAFGAVVAGTWRRNELTGARSVTDERPRLIRFSLLRNPPHQHSTQVAAYLALRATLCPALMAGLARLLGFRGDAAAALVVLALLPVAQTAFVVCKQYDEGTHAVTALMVASLLAMLPQLVVVLAALEALGAFAP